MIEAASEDRHRLPIQRVQPAQLLLAVIDPHPVASSEPRGTPRQYEVRRPIAPAPVTGRIGEGLDQQHPMPPGCQRVGAQLAQTACQHRRSNIRSSRPRQHTKPLVVDHIAQPAVLGLLRPADIRLARSHRQAPSTEPGQRHPLTVLHRHVTPRPAVQAPPQEVMLVQQLLETAPLVRAHQAHSQATAPLETIRSHPPACSTPRHRNSVPPRKPSSDTVNHDFDRLPAEDPATRRSRQHRPLRAHGKRLRREIINVPGRLAHHARGLTVHLHPSQHDGPLVAVYTALAALPSYSGP